MRYRPAAISLKPNAPNRPPAGERAHGYVGILLSREEQAALRPALSRENRQGRNPVGPAGRNRGGDLPAGGGVAEVGGLAPAVKQA